MQGGGGGQQQNLIPGSAGTPYNAALLFQAQAGQVSGQILAPRLALMPGARAGAAPMGAGTAAAAGAQYRQAGVHLPGMGMVLKAPPRKSGPNQKGRKHCNCKNSRCLKLYCECFASGRYCDNCNCLSCFNNKESEAVRQSAVEAILERNPNAFRPKIQTAEGDSHPQSIRNAPDGSIRHTKGCNCKKSSCLKKYCECFQGNIFCTEICKCVDCKNYDGSEARAQVLSCHEPFNMQSLHQAAQAHAAMKRPRLQVPQMTTTVGSTGLLQAQNALQHLAAAAAAGGPNAPSMPLQQLQAMQAAAAAAQQQQQQEQVQQQQHLALPFQEPARSALLDAVHDLVKPEVVEELCQLLVLVAGEAADKQQHQQQQQQQQRDQTANGTNGEEQHEPADAAAATVVKVQQDCDGDIVMQEAAPHQQQQQQQQSSSPAAGADPDEYSACYAAQEAVVLQEFNSILQRIIAQAEKKSSVAAASAAAAAAAGVGTADAGQEQAASGSGTEANEQHQPQLQQLKPVAQSVAMRPPVFSMPQQQAMAQQQAMMLQAASNNYALAQLQSRHAYLTSGSSAGQQLTAFGGAGALGLQQMQQMQQMQHMQHMQHMLPGLRPVGMQQMVQVMAQDGSVHQIPAQSLMSLLPGALQPQQQQAALPGAVNAVSVSGPLAAGAMASSAAPASVGAGMSLLSLLNGAINTSSSSAAGTAGGS